MNEKESRDEGIFTGLGKKLDGLMARMSKMHSEEEKHKMEDSIKSQPKSGQIKDTLSKTADKAEAIWKDSTGSLKSVWAEWRKNHDSEIRESINRAEGWIKDQKGNARGVLDKMIEKVQNKLKK